MSGLRAGYKVGDRAVCSRVGRKDWWAGRWRSGRAPGSHKALGLMAVRHRLIAYEAVLEYFPGSSSRQF